ncbi:hypothetical protein Ae505Ps2_1827 [Pseudonocardia sp. Ae505_Ps2]|nr:hypothetical protein Ae505Ps2_1827 [Pseudonocardia sp. Ae505_Ps2]
MNDIQRKPHGPTHAGIVLASSIRASGSTGQSAVVAVEVRPGSH